MNLLNKLLIADVSMFAIQWWVIFFTTFCYSL